MIKSDINEEMDDLRHRVALAEASAADATETANEAMSVANKAMAAVEAMR